MCYDQTWARKSHQDWAVRFVTATSWPERATETRQYDLLRLRVGQKESPRQGNTICYGQELARRSHQDSAVRFVTVKRGPERATKTRQYNLLRLRVVQKKSPRLGNTICYGQELARRSHQDSAVRFVTVKYGPERAPRLGSTICYGQELARKSHQDSAVRFVTAKPGPERATKTRQYDLLRPRVGQKEPPRLGSTICYGQTWARKSHQASAARFVTAKSWPEKGSKTGQYDLLRPSWPERATKTQQYNLFWPRIWPERATKTRQYDLLRPRVVQKEPPRLGSTVCYGQTWARKSHQGSAVQFVTAKSCPEKVTKTGQYDLLRPRVGQKEPPRLGSTICYGQIWARKSHQDSAVRFATAKSWPERATKTRQYDLLRPNLGQKEPPRLGSTICYGQDLARKSHRDSAVRFVTDKRGPERATKPRRYDLLRPRVVQKEPPRLGFVTAKSWPERATKTRQYDLLRPNVGQSHQDSAVRFVTAKPGPERASKTRQYDLLRPNTSQKEPPRLGSTVCYGQTWARKSHQDSVVRFVTAKSCLERATETRQYHLLRPRLG